MGDEARTAVQPSIAPARYEPDHHTLEQGKGVGLDLYRLVLPEGYARDNSANRAFTLDRLYVDQAERFSNKELVVVGTKVNSLFGYRLSKEDEKEIGEAVKDGYPPPVENPDFQLTTVQVLIATLRAAGRVLGPKIIEKAQEDTAAMGLEASDGQELKQGWASFLQGVAEGVADKLENSPDAVGERTRVEELGELIDKANGEEEKKQGEDIKGRLKYGLEMREEAAKNLRQCGIGEEAWRASG